MKSRARAILAFCFSLAGYVFVVIRPSSSATTILCFVECAMCYFLPLTHTHMHRLAWVCGVLKSWKKNRKEDGQREKVETKTTKHSTESEKSKQKKKKNKTKSTAKPNRGRKTCTVQRTVYMWLGNSSRLAHNDVCANTLNHYTMCSHWPRMREPKLNIHRVHGFFSSSSSSSSTPPPHPPEPSLLTLPSSSSTTSCSFILLCIPRFHFYSDLAFSYNNFFPHSQLCSSYSGSPLCVSSSVW